MKRFLIMVLAVGVMAGSMATAGAQQPRRVERTVVGSYGPYPAPVTGCNAPLGSFACLQVDTRSPEAYFTATVTDTHGLPVFVEVLMHGRYGQVLSSASFCGATARPVRIPAGASLSFHVGLNNSLVSTHCLTNRVKTTGTISVTLSNRH